MPRRPDPPPTPELPLDGPRPAAPAGPAPLDVPALRRELSAWYHARRRVLPWREEPAPYRVWVSEIMLQQTQVATVQPYFERFVARFPSVTALAEAPEDAVLEAWAGLGYYRRARLLHAAAKAMVSDHGGAVPGTVDALLALPGIGRYTAGAVASIAFGVPAPLLDGNVARVLSRLVALTDPIDASAGSKALWALAEVLVSPDDPSSHNQALMELGALVCTPKRPECDLCPVARWCVAHGSPELAPEAFPNKKPRNKPVPMHAVAGVVRDATGRHVLMARRPPEGLLGGLWELPSVELRAGEPRRDGVARALRERVGVTADVGGHVGSVAHVFSHRRLTLELYRVRAIEGTPRAADYYDAIAWVRAQSGGEAHDAEGPADARPLPLSKLTRKVLATLEARDG